MKTKILRLDELALKIETLKKEQKKIVLCHGCFDVLHFGHLRHFVEAKKKADFLAVTVTPNDFVNKGKDRPIFSEEHRIELLSGLSVIDYLSINRWPSAVKTIKLLRPTFYAKGSEYESSTQTVNPLFEEEKKALREINGKMVFTYEKTSSSSSIIQKIQKL